MNEVDKKDLGGIIDDAIEEVASRGRVKEGPLVSWEAYSALLDAYTSLLGCYTDLLRELNFDIGGRGCRGRTTKIS